MQIRKFTRALLVLLITMFASVQAAEHADIIVAQDGSGDYTTITDALAAVPQNNSELFIILIKNGVYNEEIRIDVNFVALVGENRDSTRIEYFKPYDWDSTYVDIGRAVVNIFANDVTLANLTVENTQEEVGIHAFTIYGANNTRTIIVNCNIISNGGDTLALWNGETGMYYHRDLYLQGAVDFLCPRGWCYVDNIEFFCTRTTTPLWHDGIKNEDQKFVIKNSSFDGRTTFNLGRNHHDGAFYMINLTFSENLIDRDWVLPESAPGPYKWGRRYYYDNCSRPSGEYDWYKDNLITAKNSPRLDQITPEWTFGGAWNPEETMPSVLPMSFLTQPSRNATRVNYEPTLKWIAGRNAESHNVYFGTSNPPEFVANTAETSYPAGSLAPNTVYYWRIDEVTEEGDIEGVVWQFKTQTDQLPTKASNPYPEDGATGVTGPVERMFWDQVEDETDTVKVYMGTSPDNLELASTYEVAGLYPDPFVLGNTYYWRVDVTNQNGTTTGDIWSFEMQPSAFDNADYVQGSDENALVVIEAEQFTNSSVVRNHEWTLVTEPEGFSGKGAMRALPDDGAFYNSKYSERSCQLDFAVNFTSPGTHYLWVRAYSTDGQDNYLHMGLNGEEVYEASRIGNFSETGQWEWIHTALNVGDPRSFEVNAIGVQSVNVWFGRDGITIDKIVLTTNPDYVPTGDEPSTWTSVELAEGSAIPEAVALYQNYPNPFNPETKIDFNLPQTGEVSLAIYDILGREVEKLITGVQQAGNHSITWLVRDRQLASGIYTAVLKAGEQRKSIKLLYLK